MRDFRGNRGPAPCVGSQRLEAVAADAGGMGKHSNDGSHPLRFTGACAVRLQGGANGTRGGFTACGDSGSGRRGMGTRGDDDTVCRLAGGTGDTQGIYSAFGGSSKGLKGNGMRRRRTCRFIHLAVVVHMPLPCRHYPFDKQCLCIGLGLNRQTSGIHANGVKRRLDNVIFHCNTL